MENYGTGNNTPQVDILAVLLKLKSSTMKDTHCTEIAVVQSIDSVITCKSLYNGDIVECLCLNGVNVDPQDIVVIVFADYDVRENINRIKNSTAMQNMSNKTPHTKNCGIIIGKL